MSLPRTSTAALLGCTLLLTGATACGSDDPPSANEPTATTDAVRPDGDPADVQTWPLTGLPVTEGRASALPRPVLVAKIDNTAGSAPQTGLGAADLVVEELVEGGVTRLAAFYYSRLPGEVGPVRSMRASDIGIVTPVDADVVTSGAAPVTIKRIGEAGIDYVSEGSAGFFRDEDRSAPYNLFANLGQVGDSLQRTRTRPDDYLPWGSEADLPKGKPARSIKATFSGSRTSAWSFADGGYVNDNSFAAAGEEFKADSVLVLRVDVGDAGYLDPAGNKVPETSLIGTGEATLFHNGSAVETTWRKDELDSAIWLGTKSDALQIPAGRVWIELIPTDGGSLSY